MKTVKTCSTVLIQKGFDWSVDFQIDPATSVVVTGAKPSLDEFRDACRHTMFPLLAIDTFYVAACVAFDAKEAANGLNA